MSKPGTTLSPARDWHASDLGARIELLNGALTYDSFASVEVMQEGAKAIEWDQKRNKQAGSGTGRYQRGVGLGMSQHHAGHMGYHEGEVYFEKRLAETRGGGGAFGAEVQLDANGIVTMKNALPDSGTNHDTALGHIVAEMLGFTTRDRIRVIWGDSETAPPSSEWVAGKTITLQGAAVCSATDKLRKDLLQRAATNLKVNVTGLQMRDGVISSTADQRKRVTFAALARANGGFIRQQGRGIDDHVSPRDRHQYGISDAGSPGLVAPDPASSRSLRETGGGALGPQSPGQPAERPRTWCGADASS